MLGHDMEAVHWVEHKQCNCTCNDKTSQAAVLLSQCLSKPSLLRQKCGQLGHDQAAAHTHVW
jgi:hypothetical protein